MMSIELLLDEASDAAVRAQWQVLVQEGLPSQARHTGASNAPHITLLAAARIGVEGLDAAAAALPVAATLGGWAVFGAAPRGLVLARLVVPTAGILGVQRMAAALAQGVDGASATTEPGSWSPHVTLASRLTPEQLAAAITALGYPEPIEATLPSARHWDGAAKILTPLSPG